MIDNHFVFSGVLTWRTVYFTNVSILSPENLV